MDRRHLIDRKHQVIAEAAQLRRRIVRLRARTPTRRLCRIIGRLEDEVDRLAAEERQLRTAIDRTPPG